MSRKKQQKLDKNIALSPQIQKQAEPIILSFSQKAKNILAAVQQRVLQDINEQSVSIPVRQIPFRINQDRKKGIQQQQQLLKLQKMMQQKQQIKRKLKQVQSNERLMQAGLHLSHVRDKSNSSAKPKSELSTQDLQKLRMLKKQQKRFEQELQQKTRIFEQNEKKLKQQQKQLIQRSRKEVNEKKRLQITKRLTQLTERQTERAKKFEEDKIQISKLKLQTKLHEQLNLKWERLEAQNSEMKRKQFEDRKKDNSVDLLQIKEHQKKYEQILRKNRQQITKRRIETSKVSHKLFTHKINQTKFHTLVIQEQEKRKRIENQKKEQIASLIQKKKQFAQAVKINYAPKLKIKSQQDEHQILKKSYIKKPIDAEQLRRKGLSYLQQAKSKADKNRVKQQSFQTSKISQIQTKTPKYHDYLSQTRQTRIQKEGKSMRLERSFDNQVQEAKNIMKKTAFSDQQKIQRVKMLAQRLESDPKTTKSSTLLKKIQAKIQILQALH